MSYFRIGDGYYIGYGGEFEALIAGCIVFCAILFIIGAGIWIACYCIVENDKSKPLSRARVKILEKTAPGRHVEWYVIQFENGERKRMRNLHSERLILTVGDIGIMEYRGITIESFRRERRSSSRR